MRGEKDGVTGTGDASARAYLCQVRGLCRKDSLPRGHGSRSERGWAGASLLRLRVRAAPVPTAPARM